MTLDELIKQLNKIKEVYPYSGKWKTALELDDAPIKIVDRVIVILNTVVFQDKK